MEKKTSAYYDSDLQVPTLLGLVVILLYTMAGVAFCSGVVGSLADPFYLLFGPPWACILLAGYASLTAYLYQRERDAQAERVAVGGLLLILTYLEYNSWHFGFGAKVLLWWLWALFTGATVIKWLNPNSGLVDP